MSGGGGNVLCELLAPDEAPLTIPDLDIFPKLQLEQIPEEDEEAEAGLRCLPFGSGVGGRASGLGAFFRAEIEIG